MFRHGDAEGRILDAIGDVANAHNGKIAEPCSRPRSEMMDFDVCES